MLFRSAEQERHRFRVILAGSLAAHVLVFLALILAPASSARLQPTVVTVDLVSPGSLPELRPAVKARAKPKPKARAKPKAPAKPSPKQVVIPKRAPKAEKKPRRAPPEELDYDEAMAKLRDELGEELEEPTEPAEAAEVARAMQSASGGEKVDPEVAAWMLATRRHVRSVWVTPPEFLERPLRTVVAIDVTADGRILGEPDVVRRSGDPFWDDNAVRALLRASPLPPPPMAGEWQISFTPRGSGR